MSGDLTMKKALRVALNSLITVTLIGISAILAVTPVFAAKDDALAIYFQAEQLEYRLLKGKDILVWDVNAWIGEDYNKIAFKSEGEKLVGGKVEAVETQFLYRRLISKFFDLEAGFRRDFRPNPKRSFAVLGIQGLAPYWFEVNGSAFLSNKGDLSARFEAGYDLLLTQKLILEPSAEVNVAFSNDAARGVGRGLSDIDLGLRLRYEITRKFAPYIGLNWERKFGKTASFARDEGESVSSFSILTGVRFWF